MRANIFDRVDNKRSSSIINVKTKSNIHKQQKKDLSKPKVGSILRGFNKDLKQTTGEVFSNKQKAANYFLKKTGGNKESQIKIDAKKKQIDNFIPLENRIDHGYRQALDVLLGKIEYDKVQIPSYTPASFQSIFLLLKKYYEILGNPHTYQQYNTIIKNLYLDILNLNDGDFSSNQTQEQKMVIDDGDKINALNQAMIIFMKMTGLLIDRTSYLAILTQSLVYDEPFQIDSAYLTKMKQVKKRANNDIDDFIYYKEDGKGNLIKPWQQSQNQSFDMNRIKARADNFRSKNFRTKAVFESMIRRQNKRFKERKQEQIRQLQQKQQQKKDQQELKLLLKQHQSQQQTPTAVIEYISGGPVNDTIYNYPFQTLPQNIRQSQKKQDQAFVSFNGDEMSFIKNKQGQKSDYQRRLIDQHQKLAEQFFGDKQVSRINIPIQNQLSGSNRSKRSEGQKQLGQVVKRGRMKLTQQIIKGGMLQQSDQQMNRGPRKMVRQENQLKQAPVSNINEIRQMNYNQFQNQQRNNLKNFVNSRMIDQELMKPKKVFAGSGQLVPVAGQVGGARLRRMIPNDKLISGLNGFANFEKGFYFKPPEKKAAMASYNKQLRSFDTNMGLIRNQSFGNNLNVFPNWAAAPSKRKQSTIQAYNQSVNALKQRKERDSQIWKNVRQLNKDVVWNAQKGIWQLPESISKKLVNKINPKSFEKNKQLYRFISNHTLNAKQIATYIPPIIANLVYSNDQLSKYGIGPKSSNGLPFYAGRWIDPVTSTIRILPTASNKYVNPLSRKQKLSFLQAKLINRWNQFVQLQQQYINLQQIDDQVYQQKVRSKVTEALRKPVQLDKVVQWYRTQVIQWRMGTCSVSTKSLMQFYNFGTNVQTILTDKDKDNRKKYNQVVALAKDTYKQLPEITQATTYKKIAAINALASTLKAWERKAYSSKINALKTVYKISTRPDNITQQQIQKLQQGKETMNDLAQIAAFAVTSNDSRALENAVDWLNNTTYQNIMKNSSLEALKPIGNKDWEGRINQAPVKFNTPTEKLQYAQKRFKTINKPPVWGGSYLKPPEAIIEGQMI